MGLNVALVLRAPAEGPIRHGQRDASIPARGGRIWQLHPISSAGKPKKMKLLIQRKIINSLLPSSLSVNGSFSSKHFVERVALR